MDNSTCQVDACERPVHMKRDQLCNAHYLQRRRGKPFGPVRRTKVIYKSTACAFEGCDKPAHALKLCSSHYWQQQRGTLIPLNTVQRPKNSIHLRDEMGRKFCPQCDQWHHVESFGKSSKQRDGLRATCRECRSLQAAGHVRGRRSIHNVESRTNLTACLDCLAWGNYTEREPRCYDCSEVARVGLAEYRRARNRDRMYSLAPGRYDQMLATQNGRCATCKRSPDAGKHLVVDHDHRCCDRVGSCGKCIRSLLCHRCNMAIGLALESRDTLLAMVEYLRDDT